MRFGSQPVVCSGAFALFKVYEVDGCNAASTSRVVYSTLWCTQREMVRTVRTSRMLM